jgi:CTP:molybdopterin cytidylyltransferase MocA
MPRARWSTSALLILLLLVGPAIAAVVSLTHAGATARPTSVAVVGDSLTWQAEPSIEGALSTAGYAASISANPGHALSSAWAQRQVGRDIRDPRIGVIVVETASNDSFELARSDPSAAGYATALTDVLRAAKGRCVVVVNAKVDVTPFYYRPADARTVNRTIADSALQFADERVVDWSTDAASHPSWFRADLLHFTSAVPTATGSGPPPVHQSAGDRAFAADMLEGIASCHLAGTPA